MRKVIVDFVLAFAVTVAAVVFVGKSSAELAAYPDAESSIAVAEGGIASVRMHHARRVFHPLVVAGVREVSGLSTRDAFVLTGLFTLFGFLFLLLAALPKGEGRLPFALACVLLPYPLVVHELCFLQLSMFLLLLAVYLHAARRDRWVFLGVGLLCLVLTREEGMLVGLCSLFALWRRGGARGGMAMLLGAMAAGQGVIWWASRGTANLHESSYVVFSLARLPAFYLRNLFGIEHWVDTYSGLELYLREPIARWSVPALFHGLGKVREIGVYAWNPENIVRTAALIFGSFGLLPIICLRLRHSKRVGLDSGIEHWSFLALGLFGLCAFVLAPGAGPAHLRYYLGAWPLFFWVLGRAGDGVVSTLFRARPSVLVCHLAAGWLLFLAERWSL